MKYDIIAITSRDEMEQLGTKEKFWFYDKNDTKKLFKIGRPGTGENWAEKIAYELAEVMGVPCAKYEFAVWNGKQGTISTSIVSEGNRLVHGNELLVIIHDEEYPEKEKYHLTDYKLDIVLNLIENELYELALPHSYASNDVIKKPIDLFIGYLIFDCWVANQDRHHENWGIILGDDYFCIAPSYDHAAGLGCKVSSEEAQKRLDTKDMNYSVKKFVTRAKSPFYSNNNVQLKTIEIVENLADKYPIIVCYWIEQIENISKEGIQDILDSVPDNFMSDASKEFAQQILYENRIRLLEIKKEKCHE